MSNGVVVAVSTSSVGGVPKYPQAAVSIGEYGIVGDFHAGPMRRSHRTGEFKSNDRQVSIVALEALEALNDELGTTLKPGDFGENITVHGLGDLADLHNGALVQIGARVVLRVTEQNRPCQNLLVYHRQMVKASYERRGILLVVEAGAGSVVRPGEPIVIRPS